MEFDSFKKCLLEEAEGIYNVYNNISLEEIEKAVKLILNIKGKVIVTGVGKSGHIGKKIAATMASTGTPSFFMHATEGVHGDLGMVSNNDVVILLSNSGETNEVLNLIPNLNKIGVKKIAITKSKDSTLGKNSDAVLEYSFRKEADHLNLAPTVSSTIQLALGDALAVCLSKIKNFNKDSFHLYHPGGSLGKSLEKKL